LPCERIFWLIGNTRLVSNIVFAIEKYSEIQQFSLVHHVEESRGRFVCNEVTSLLIIVYENTGFFSFQPFPLPISSTEPKRIREK
jgi:hypothetical protein